MKGGAEALKTNQRPRGYWSTWRLWCHDGNLQSIQAAAQVSTIYRN